MPRHWPALSLLIAAQCLLAACATTLQPMAQPDAAQRMADQAIVYNESYAKAVTGQIFLNILRARDRQPRYYLSMSGITDDTTSGASGSAGIGGIGLGNPVNPWGLGSFSADRFYESNPAYKVEPFDKNTLAAAIFSPTSSNIFAHYWEGGWPRDLLVLILVDRITRIGPGETAGKYSVQTFENEANNVANDCNNDVRSSGCDFVHTMRIMLSDASAVEARSGEQTHPKPIKDDCPALDENTIDQQLLEAARAHLSKACQPRLELDNAVYVLSLRSFDDAVYYVGEMLRPAVTQGAGAEMASPIKVGAAGLKGGGNGVPLFRMLTENAARAEIKGDPRGRYAASVLYSGQRLYAGAPVGRSCPHAAQSGPCADDAAHGDRTSSVLSLLAELLSLNQSPEAIKPPDRSLR